MSDEFGSGENIETKLVERQIDLTDDDRLEIAVKLADLDSEENRVEVEKRNSAAAFSSQLNAIKSEQKMLFQQYRDGFVVEQVECYWEMDAAEGVVRYISVETDKMVSFRKMTNEERQLKLFGEK
ncbi:MAG TPA: hypothetical protein VMY59_04540 [Candidatus Thermoplasmatota archaeon]|nr:hypothetical protein [Candidatus Thermoplasmatota archaeon]